MLPYLQTTRNKFKTFTKHKMKYFIAHQKFFIEILSKCSCFGVYDWATNT